MKRSARSLMRRLLPSGVLPSARSRSRSSPPLDLDVVLLCDVVLDTAKIDASRHWSRGPYIHTYQDHQGRTVSTDRDARATNFPASLAPYLLGSRTHRARAVVESETRWHTPISSAIAPLGLDAPGGEGRNAVLEIDRLEILAHLSGTTGERLGILAVHGTVRADRLGDQIQAVTTLASARSRVPGQHARGVALMHHLRSSGHMDAIAAAGDTQLLSGAEAGVYPLIVARPHGRDLDLEASAQRLGMNGDDLALFCAASGQRPDRLRSAPVRIKDALDKKIVLSRSWQALVMRKGASIMLSADVDPGFEQLARIYARTLYTDALILARLQDLLVREYETEMHLLLADSGQWPEEDGASRRWRTLGRRIATDRARYWMSPAISTTGHAIMFLRGYHGSVRLHDRLDAVDDQARTLTAFADQDARESQTRAQDRIALLVGVFGVVAVPLAIVDQVLTHTQLLSASHGGLIAVALYPVLVGLSGLGVLMAARSRHRDP